jgi:phospholipase C
MHQIKKKKWISTLAAGAMLSAQLAMPLYGAAQEPDNDASFRKNLIGGGLLSNPIQIPPTALRLFDPLDRSNATKTPIKHVILIIGENRTFDHVFATYTPPAGQTVSNLLSKGIVTTTGALGANSGLATQWQASDTTTFSPSPPKTTAFPQLPAINTDGAPQAPHFPSASAAEAFEPALPTADYDELANGGSGLAGDVVDTRFLFTVSGSNVNSYLPNFNGPLDMDPPLSYDDYASSPVHRFFQMWQQLDCDAAKTTKSNTSGCQNDLFPWVETTIGAGSNGAAQPNPFTNQTTGEGSTAMQFFNVANGTDVPYFTQLAQQYSLSDNFHQSVMGGTGANHIMLGYGSLIYYADTHGNPAIPPAGQIENPDPQQGTNNYYTDDGYGSTVTGKGGSYVNCSDNTQAGVAPILAYLNALPYHPFLAGDCQRNAYYLVNNYNPGYLGDGTPAPLGATQFTIPPTTQNNIGLLLSKHHVSWKYYGEGWDGGKEDGEGGTFCNICDPFLYSTQIMTNPSLRAHNQDIEDLYSDISSNALPAVSIVKPDGLLDGHPASSKLDLFEGFCQKIIEMAQANPQVWKDTAVMITFDEGGGYWDSGYVQTIDFFGDGTRIPLLVVSPYSQGGRVVHTYYDHVSFDKFVEANWNLGETISKRSRDNLNNPITKPNNPYVPLNSPAIGDLMDMFNFHHNPI